jgi:type IV pilus assembly protein PilO
MSDFLDQFDKVPLSQKVLLLVLLGLGVFVAYFFLFRQDIETQLADQNRRLQDLSNQRAELNASVEDVDRIQEEIEELCSRQEAFLDKLPPRAEIPSLLSDINQQGQLSGLEIQEFRRLQMLPGPNYNTVPVSVRLKGSYDEIADFFYFVGRQQRIVSVNNISIAGEPNVNPWRVTEMDGRGLMDFARDREEIGPPELSVNCTLRTYYTSAATFAGGEICGG